VNSGPGEPRRLKLLALLVAVIYVAFFTAYMSYSHSSLASGGRYPGGAALGGAWQLPAIGLASALAVFLLVWRLNVALWRAAQAEAAREDAERRLSALLAGGPRGLVGRAGERGAAAERVQAAIYAISEAASSTASLHELFRAIHAAVGELMPAHNFYLALYDAAAQQLSFPYFVDEVDPPPEPKPLGKGITEYVLRTGAPLLASPSVAAELERAGEIELIGAPSIDWLGVPLKVEETTFGVLVVQSYTEGVRYGEAEKAILIFVSRQVAMAIARSRAREALRASEQRLREIVEHSTNLFYSHTPDHVLTYVSPQTREFFDAEPEEVLVRWTELATDNPVNRVGYERTLRAIETGQPQPPYELELVGKRGRKIWVDVHEAPVVRDGRTIAIVGSLTDITERRHVEEALRTSEATNRAILEAIPDIVFRVSADGVFLDYKASRLTDLYLPPGVFLGRHLSAVLPPDVARLSLDNIRAALADGKVHIYEYELELAGENRFWEGRIVATGAGEVVVIIREITERWRAEQALRESEERYRRLVELSPDGIAIHQDGRLVYCNETGATLLGYSSSREAIGRPVLSFVHPASRDVVVERIRTALASGQAQPPIQERFLRADGSALDVEVASIPFLLAGRPAVQAVIRDISFRLRLEEHVRQGQKMEAIGRLAGGVAHDFNNLLQALLSTVEVLRVRGARPDTLEATVAELEAHVKRGAALTRQLLLFARREMVKRELLDLNDVVLEAAKLLRRLVRETIQLSLRPESGSLSLDADRGQLEQVLVNLVVNGSEAMPEGGEIVIRTGRHSDREVFLEVEDGGIGILDEDRDRIFEPFFTTRAAEGGTGLGLAVVHGIVLQHGGRLEVASRVGHGSTFRVILPATAIERVVAATGAASDIAVLRGHGERVLVVEDEDGARRALTEILELLGFEVSSAASGEAAEEMARSAGFDLLLTDFVLPGIDGGELARRLTALRPEIKVVLMSGYAEDEAMRSSVSSGAVRFLQKPFDFQTLSRAVRDALGEEEQPVPPPGAPA
jgi:two-component system, cell cycle sensor histidine kinase and response regulator CckA